MGFVSLLLVASMPVLQILLVGLLGALLASAYVNVLSSDARRDMNKVVYVVFAPSLVFVSLASTASLQDFVSWWFMLVNIGMTFLIGGILGWIAVRILKPESHLGGLVIANCAAGNLGALPLILIPAICDEGGNPFGDRSICRTRGLSYVSLSMALGNIFLWTHAYSLMKEAAGAWRAKTQQNDRLSKVPKDSDAIEEAHVCRIEAGKASDDQKVSEQDLIVPLLSNEKLDGNKVLFLGKVKEILHQIAEALMTPPIIVAIAGFIVGTIPWLKALIIGETAVLRVLQDSMVVLGAGTVPCVTLILGGNLTQGLRMTVVKPLVSIAIICVRFVILPIAGIIVVKAASQLGFLPGDPLYCYVLMIQFALPPAMAIGTMAQLFNVGQEECSIIFLWTYLVAAPAITCWSTVFMWILS